MTKITNVIRKITSHSKHLPLLTFAIIVMIYLPHDAINESEIIIIV